MMFFLSSSFIVQTTKQSPTFFFFAISLGPHLNSKLPNSIAIAYSWDYSSFDFELELTFN